MSCQYITGSEAFIADGTTPLAMVTSYDWSNDYALHDITTLTSLAAKSCLGLQSFTVNAGYFIDVNDEFQYQFILDAINGVDRPNLRIYLDANTYFAIDLVSDADGTFRINNISGAVATGNAPQTGTLAIIASGPVVLSPSSV